MSTHFCSVEISFVDIVVELMTITVSFHNSHLYWLKKTKTKANKNKKQTKSHKKNPKTNKQTKKKKEKKEALYIYKLIMKTKWKIPMTFIIQIISQFFIDRREKGNKYYYAVLLIFVLNVFSFYITHWRQSWSWWYGSRIYNYLWNRCLSPLKLWVRITLKRGVLDTTLCDKVCQ
jgi:magnesium-transporting ATPase (P-type)